MSQPERDFSVHPDTLRASLREVTGEGSTDALRQRLQADLERIELQDNDLIQGSIELAIQLHDGQKRTYESYINHVLRVAIRLIEQFGIRDPEILAAAILHDSVEDQAIGESRQLLNTPACRPF